MQKVSCPSCGAPVEFKSAASVMAVCSYCSSTLFKDAETLRDIGKMSEVMADYSPIQIGTSGQFDGIPFDVIGRIQLRYPGGMWNEWYLQFADAHTGWLSDASGQFAVTTEQKAGDKAIPDFNALRIGAPYSVGGVLGIAADIRTADCIGGQGELPFKVGKGWQARVADFRNLQGFVTADYSEAPPTIYSGRAVTLAQLQPQLLRDDDVVRDAAGNITRSVERFACPSCGGSVAFVPGLTTQSICPSCHQPLDTTATVARALEATARMERNPTTLALGASATISGVVYELIGVLKQRDDDNEHWFEYLLYSPRAGLLWLIETDTGWYQAAVQDIWPQWDGGDTAVLGDKRFKKVSHYQATVEFAAGAFNWKVGLGDAVQVTEFELGRARLAAEQNTQELTWSLATLVPEDQMRAWFGAAYKSSAIHPTTPLRTVVHYSLIGLLVINAVPLLMAFSETWLAFLLAAAALYLPTVVLGSDKV